MTEFASARTPDGPESPTVYLRALARRFPTSQSALAEIAHLRAVLTLPKGTVHIVSDVHGEDRKLNHIIKNASGTLRPLVDRIFGDRLDEAERHALLNLIYYPREALAFLEPRLQDAVVRRDFVRTTVRRLFEVVAELASRYSARDVERVFPDAHRLLMRELLLERGLGRDPRFVDAMLDGMTKLGADADLLRTVAHVVRNLLIYELIVAGDLGDRGPRIDRAGLLKYLVSFRKHGGFHEHCVERIFMDILQRCRPEGLTVYARYTRRGGLDINPFRTNCGEKLPRNVRTARQ